MERAQQMTNTSAIGNVLLGAVIANVLLFSATTAQAQTPSPTTCLDAVGVWKSSVGSILTIKSVQNNQIQGTFLREPPAVAITGSIGPAVKGNCTLSFSAYWPQSGKYYATVTSYTGVLNVNEKKISVVFLYVDPKAPSYQTVSVGNDFFTHVKP